MKKNIFLFLLGVSLLFITNDYVIQKDKELIKKEYTENKGETNITMAAKLIGTKKATVGFLWTKQILIVGEGNTENVEKTIEKIIENRKKITYLNPYFERNYQFSGSVLAFINIYKRYDLATEIFKEGIFYNPKSKALKKYMTALISLSKNDVGGLLKSFEEVVSETKDDLLTNSLALTYGKIFENTKEELYLEKSKFYWKKLSTSKDVVYALRAKKKLKELEK